MYFRISLDLMCLFEANCCELFTKKKMVNAIAIDLGASYCCVGIFQRGNVVFIPDDQGNCKMPSYVAFTDTELLVGHAAKSQMKRNPANTVFDIPRLLGRRFEDPVLQSYKKHRPFKIIVAEGGHLKIEVVFKAMLLTKMKQMAEEFLDQPVKDVVITTSTYFTFSKRHALRSACEIVGLNPIRFVSSATAAGIAYGLDKTFERTVLIFDLGGGTLDVSILTVEYSIIEVKSVAGDKLLGGEDFTDRLVNHCVAEFRRKHKKDLTSNPRALCRLRDACEDAKRTLSSSARADIVIDSLFKGIDFFTNISRSCFEELCSDLFPSIIDTVEKALPKRMEKEDIHDIVLVGGSTRIPKIQNILSEFFDGKKLSKNINPDEAAAHGAAVQAAILSGDISGILQGMLLVDVAPLSLGIETAGGVMAKIVNCNSTVPTKTTPEFTTFADNQPAVLIQIYEGESAIAAENNLLGKLVLQNISPAPSGEPRIKVTFDIDANCVLMVTVKDESTGKQDRIVITNPENHSSNDDYKEIINEPEKYQVERADQKIVRKIVLS
uniref:Heat shock protein 70 n=1 Tax=Panagrolaimus sp. JU765 TaxID=591449 RepID=A0AC34R2U2_9BILA